MCLILKGKQIKLKHCKNKDFRITFSPTLMVIFITESLKHEKYKSNLRYFHWNHQQSQSYNLEVFSEIKIVQRFQGTPLFLCCDNTITKNICVLNNNVVIFFSIKSPIFIKNAIIIVANIFLYRKADVSKENVEYTANYVQNTASWQMYKEYFWTTCGETKTHILHIYLMIKSLKISNFKIFVHV